MSKNDIFTDPKYAAVDGNIYHDTIFDNSKGKNNKAKVQEPVYSDDGETLVLLCSLLVPLFKKIFPATDIQIEVQWIKQNRPTRKKSPAQKQMKRHQHIAFLAVFIAILLLILFSNKFRDFSNSIPGIVVMGIFSYFSLCVVVGFLKIASREEAVNTQAEEIIRKEKEASEQPKNNINHS